MVAPFPNNELPFDNSPWILPINKPAGLSSYDVIRSLKRPIFELLGKGKGRRKLKVGHFGTLDPFAEGILLVGTGKALKLVQFFQNHMNKTYEGVGSFEFSTDTGDIEGQTLNEEREVLLSSIPIELGELNSKAQDFIGSYEQRPPYFSAVKHEGRPLYEWAREGKFIQKPLVSREVYDFQIIEKLNDLEFRFSCSVSSGTYIRGLWHDLAKLINRPGHLKSLNRVGWGNFNVSNAQELPIESLSHSQLKLACDLWKIPFVKLTEVDSELFNRGQFIPQSHLEMEVKPFQWVLNERDQLLGLGVPKRVGKQVLLKVEVNLT